MQWQHSEEVTHMHLSRGYILEGFLPVRICFPSLFNVEILGQVDISEHILLDSFVSSLNSVNHNFSIASKLNSFPQASRLKLLTV